MRVGLVPDHRQLAASPKVTTEPGLFQAFVLHRRDYGDTSLLVEVLARGTGRFPAIAKGARRGRNATSALLQPFQPLWLGAVGRGEVRTLTRIEAAGRSFELPGRALLCGLYLNEILVRLLARNDPHDELFAFYHAALSQMGADAELDRTLRQFELRLLGELGYAPPLDREAHGHRPVDPDCYYVMDPGHPPRLAGEEETETRVWGATLLALARGGPLDPVQRREARTLLRRLLAPHLGSKPLRSRELFRRVTSSE
jgi:DNA repair protein RecO (recombination protein O)